MKKIIGSLFCLAWIGCAPQTQFLVKTYPTGQLDNKSVLLYPVAAKQINITNPDDFTDDFEDVKANPNEFMSTEITDNAATQFESGFKIVQVENGANHKLEELTSANSDKVTEKIGQDGFEIRVPTTQYLESKGLKPKFVLVLDQIIYSRNLATYQQTMPSGPSTVNVGGQMVKTGAVPMTVTTSKSSISMGLNYLLYDYEDKTVVGYGFAKGEKAFSFAMTRSDWYAAMNKAFEAIQKFMPFK